jgi:hypothetical protein
VVDTPRSRVPFRSTTLDNFGAATCADDTIQEAGQNENHCFVGWRRGKWQYILVAKEV